MTTATVPNKSPAAPSVATQAEAMEKLMRGLIDEHARLLQCLERKREAVRQARLSDVNAHCDEEHRIIQRMNDFERHRRDLVRRIGNALQVPRNEDVTISRIAGAVPDPLRTRLEAGSAQLRDAVLEVRKQSSVVRAAAEALARHMSGVMQSVHSALSRAGVYGRRGHLAMGTQLEFNVDVKS